MRETTSRSPLLVCVWGDEGPGAFFPGEWKRGNRAGGRRPSQWPGPGPRTAARGEATVGCVWQSTDPPDGRFADARVHQRFAPRHRKPPRLVRIARATAPAVGRLRTRLFPPEMHEDPAEVL